MATWPDSGLAGVRALGVNAVDHGDTASVRAMCAGITIPFVQDTEKEHLWDDAGAQKDDIFVLNAARRVVRVFSCFDRPLTTAANRDTLRAWIRDAMVPVVSSPHTNGGTAPW